MHHFYIELEDLCFAALNPLRYALLKKAVHKARGARKQMVVHIQEKIKESLALSGMHEVKVVGRQKHVYSIYKKMRQKHLSFNEIMDVFAFRIIVPTVDDCYRSLGLIHNLYKPVPNALKIILPFLKIIVINPCIRLYLAHTVYPSKYNFAREQMNKMAENGIAAHWLYKSAKSHFDKAHVRAREWL